MKTYCGAGNKLDELIPYLLGNLVNKGYHLYMDNFYNSVGRCEILQKLGTQVCGTMRRQRGEPDVMKKITAPSQLKEDEKITRHNGAGVLLTVWRDGKNKMARMATTIHEDKMVTVLERKKGQQERVRRLKPQCVHEYNKYMNGVDRMDQRIAYYPFARRSLRWNLKYVMYMFELCFSNAFIVYRSKGGKLVTQLDFILSVVESWTAVRAPARPDEVEGAVGGEGEEEEEEEVGGRDEEGEEDGAGFLPLQAEHVPNAPKKDPETRMIPNFAGHVLVELPAVGKGGKHNPYKDCRVHARNKKNGHCPGKTTRYYCKECKVPLCPVECYFVYHSVAHYENYFAK